MTIEHQDNVEDFKEFLPGIRVLFLLDKIASSGVFFADPDTLTGGHTLAPIDTSLLESYDVLLDEVIPLVQLSRDAEKKAWSCYLDFTLRYHEDLVMQFNGPNPQNQVGPRVVAIYRQLQDPPGNVYGQIFQTDVFENATEEGGKGEEIRAYLATK